MHRAVHWLFRFCRQVIAAQFHGLFAGSPAHNIHHHGAYQEGILLDDDPGAGVGLATMSCFGRFLLDDLEVFFSFKLQRSEAGFRFFHGFSCSDRFLHRSHSLHKPVGAGGKTHGTPGIEYSLDKIGVNQVAAIGKDCISPGDADRYQ